MKADQAFSVSLLVFCIAIGSNAIAQIPPPHDLWTPSTMERIRDRSTLSPEALVRTGYFEVSFNSEIGTANWADSGPPYGLHTGDTIRIHGYLATPLLGGPYPAIVIGHGHGGRGSPELAIALAALGYVALSIDGPMAGGSTGGPQDTEQAWISVEPDASYSYLFHYAYAGMRALTLFEALAALPGNPFRINPANFGVIGASMGGQFVYYLNGIDERIKGAVAMAAAGDWQRTVFYPGAWLYHGLYYYTRDGIPSQTDAPNAVTDVCTDPTLLNFLSHFDPISYAPRQHGPLLTIIGTHDQYFTAPAVNTTFDRTGSADTNSRFIKRLLLSPNTEHGLLDEEDLVRSVPPFLQSIAAWFRYAFRSGPPPPATPTVSMAVSGSELVLTVHTTPVGSAIQSVRLYAATQIDTLPSQPNDFGQVALSSIGNGQFRGSIRMGDSPPSGPPFSAENILYFAQVEDTAGHAVSSQLYYKSEEMGFCDNFLPVIEHYPRDSFPVQPPPSFNCTCRPVVSNGGVVNGASFAPTPAPVAPGSIAALFGSNLNNGLTVLTSSLGPDGKLADKLAGTQVRVNGISAPLFYSTTGQIGFQVPSDLAGQFSATVEVVLGDQASESHTIPLDVHAPGIFTVSQDGHGIAAALHEDGATPVTLENPARPGEVISVFATGLGQMDPPVITGVPAATSRTLATAWVTIDGVSAAVQYSGTAPGFVGLDQVNVRVPENTRTGRDIPLVLSIGQTQSNVVSVPVGF